MAGGSTKPNSPIGIVLTNIQPRALSIPLASCARRRVLGRGVCATGRRLPVVLRLLEAWERGRLVPVPGLVTWGDAREKKAIKDTRRRPPPKGRREPPRPHPIYDPDPNQISYRNTF